MSGASALKPCERAVSVLLGDIGGTYARFALAGELSIGSVWSVEVANYLNVVEAITEFMASRARGARIDGALLAAAGPVEGGRCKLTNAAWTLDEEEIARRFGLPWVRIVNDLEAVAAGLSDLPASQTRLIGPDGRPARRADGHRGAGHRSRHGLPRERAARPSGAGGRRWSRLARRHRWRVRQADRHPAPRVRPCLGRARAVRQRSRQSVIVRSPCATA